MGTDALPCRIRALSTSASAADAGHAPPHALPALLAAARALHAVLAAAAVPHAFAGGAYPALLAGASAAADITCVVERGEGGMHPFRRVLAALAAGAPPDLVPRNMPWASQLAVRHGAVEIAILPAGESGPRRLDAHTTAPEHGLPWLSPTEFVRAALRAWALTGARCAAADAAAVLVAGATRLAPGRLDPAEVRALGAVHPEVAPAWAAVRRRWRAEG